MESATGTTALILGVYAGLLGMVHGLFEISQGPIAPTGLLVNAVGAACQPSEEWHGCLPAMTVLPNLLAAGVLTLIVGFLVLIWAIWFARRRRGGLVLILLSILLLLVGGGFVPAFTGILGGTAVSAGALTSHHLPYIFHRIGALLWPWPLVVFVGWSLGGWLPGQFFNDAMLAFGGLLFVVFDVGLPLLCVFSAIAAEGQHLARTPA